ncbi:o-succinylbenzoate--CoA ligase [Desulfofundulus kuznetsovii DSM 6115]|uniref:O-succinylbenzoate--CoA ligase n=1 Tax=Desulfofundulus kuznetsovii (strain DSM 6115 / VKM B-1805 / 17) TaxID=760568 RepID=A0AAU8PTG6_DESK7|nr:o-succinylbenzoate--CoA ligase [Desulfofundulus kuznetsovii DSM 6115]
MMKYPLLVRTILERSRQLFPKKEIVSRDFSSIFRYTYGEFYERVCRLANVLEKLGVKRGDRVATLAWNNHRHLELYFAVPCIGAVLHTVNLRLFSEQIVYILNHAGDKLIFIDEDLVPIIEGIKEQIKTIELFVIMTDKESIPGTSLSPVYSYEDLLREAPPVYDFPTYLDEWSPAAMCYTTATTGDPKGVMYSHRALYLHSLMSGMVDTFAVSEKDVLMPVVPMFHVNAWGLPFTATLVGAKQVLPGVRPDPRTLCSLIESERVTVTAGVPTIWMECFKLLEDGSYDVSSLNRILAGGSAIPRVFIEAYEKKLGINVMNVYGMTETTPITLVSRPKSYMLDWPEEQLYQVRAKQGLFVPGIEMRVVDENGNSVPRDGRAMGELQFRGPWITEEYYKDPERTGDALRDGWFRTQDIVTVDEEGYVYICDRSKDLIKSGGEWISSVDLENTIMAHPAVAEAVVIAMPHEKWQERPLACVVLKEEFRGKVTAEDILEFLRGRVAKWWLPDRVEFIDEIPKTSVGKFNKKALRHKFFPEYYGA